MIRNTIILAIAVALAVPSIVYGVPLAAALYGELRALDDVRTALIAITDYSPFAFVRSW